jgi:hypothetical protein
LKIPIENEGKLSSSKLGKDVNNVSSVVRIGRKEGRTSLKGKGLY